ncbi:MAG TPA: LamG-like jellyroll fold domain-containing protein [Streptosporangiaceae bacterium]|nr:LamG-like jellyroll fold domain-containing protein [Streptosporangiaceae bacterium]
MRRQAASAVAVILAISGAGLAAAAPASGSVAGPAGHAARAAQASPAARLATAAPATAAAPASSPAPETVQVNLADPAGQFRGGASGSLYGIYDQGVPSDNLIQGMGLQTTDTKAQDGQQHPGSDALEVAAPFTASGGRYVYIYMTDVYRNFPYERTSYAQYRGYMKNQVDQVLTSPYRSRIVLVPYNEPDGNWFGGLTRNATTLAAFESEWLQTYRFLRGLWPQAKIAGPNFSGFFPAALGSFLQFCLANNCLPDVMTWHELQVPATVRADVSAYRALETTVGLPGHLPVNIDEYAARYQLTSPGQMVAWLSALEDARVDGDLPYWNINGSLGDSVAQQNIPNAQWWLYNWYSSMNGQDVAVTTPGGVSNDTLQGLATLDKARRQARIILGGGPNQPVNAVISHIDPAIFGHTVHATVLQDRWSGMTGAAAQPTRTFDGSLPVSADGSVTLPVTAADQGDGGQVSCDATGPRSPGRIGPGALTLCGNNEYVSAPKDLVSGLTNFTISAWVKPSQNTAWSRVFDFGTGTNDYMFLTLSAGGGPIRFAITNSGAGGEQQINGTATLPLNTWSHVAVTLSGTTGTLYVNGTPVGTNTNMTLTPAALGATTQDWIGRSQYPADPYLNGSIDDFGVYSRALSGAEVAALAGGQPGAGDVADYAFDESGGATAADSSGSGSNATIISDPQQPPAMSAYEVILSPGGGSATPADATWLHSYLAADATMTGSGWNINTEGTPGNLGGFATAGDQDVGGLRTGSSTVITFSVTVPQTGNYQLSVFDGSNASAGDVNGPTNIFARVDGGDPQQIWLPAGYNWVIWNHAGTTVHLTAGSHQISLSTTGANGQATSGDAIINKIDLQLEDPAVQDPAVYEAEQAGLSGGAGTDFRPQGQSGAGAADLSQGGAVTFWTYSAADGYSDLAFRYRGPGSAQATVNGEPVAGALAGGPGWVTAARRVYLSAGVNKVVVTGAGGALTLDNLTVTPVAASDPAVHAATATYQAEDGTLTGTAHADNSYSQASGGVVTGISGGAANSLTLTVHAAAAGRYGMTVRFANNQMVQANHYNPDLMTAPADISVNGGPAVHVNFASTFSWNQFWNLTIPVQLRRGANTITFSASQQYNYDGKTIGVIYSGQGIGQPLRSDTAPSIDQVTLAPFQLPAAHP